MMETEHLGKQDVTTFFDLELDGFHSTFELNFLGTFLPTKVFARDMVEKKSGSVLNMASMIGITPLKRSAPTRQPRPQWANSPAG